MYAQSEPNWEWISRSWEYRTSWRQIKADGWPDVEKVNWLQSLGHLTDHGFSPETGLEVAYRTLNVICLIGMVEGMWGGPDRLARPATSISLRSFGSQEVTYASSWTVSISAVPSVVRRSKDTRADIEIYEDERYSAIEGLF